MIKTRLLSVSFPGGGYGSVATNREKMVMYLEKAGAYQPDFVCFTEVARELGVPTDSEEWKGEPIPGPTTEALGSVARKYKTYMIVGMQERAGTKTFNAAALIGRDGAVMGVFGSLTDAKGFRYHKVQPTTGEMEGGTIPSTEAPTWETDRGRVGMCSEASPTPKAFGSQGSPTPKAYGICFDLKFPEVAMMLARAGARIVFFPSMFHGGMRHGAWTRDYGVFLVVSQSQESVIVDMASRSLLRKPLRAAYSLARISGTFSGAGRFATLCVRRGEYGL